MRVILADDHPVVRAGVRHIIEKIDATEVVAEAGDGRTLLDLVDALLPDVVVMDISMPELNGIDAARAIRGKHPGVHILILSVHCTETAVVDAIEAGVAGYLLKEAASEELPRALAAIVDDKSYFSPGVARLLATRLTERGGRRAMLTPREREVVQLIGEGRTIREIATRLFVSTQTIKSHRVNAMRKLGSRTTADLIRYAISQGWSPIR